MSGATLPRGSARRPLPRPLLIGAPVVVLVGLMALSTHVVVLGSKDDARPQAFSPDAFGAEQFPKVVAWVDQHAADAPTLVSELAANKADAVAKHGNPGAVGPELAVRFTGVVGEGEHGLYPVTVAGLPDGTRIRVQMGPAINGVDLRDVSGTIQFGQFHNQIEYQNAGAALNKEMKKDVLAKIDRASLTGKTIAVTGVFQLINPANWLVTPVEVKIQ